VDFRLRHHSAIWALLWPVRMWFRHAPLHRGKGLIYRHLILPALPPRPAAFSYRLRDGQVVELFYREDLGTKVLFGGSYEDREAAELCRLVRPGTWVFDVGANIGLTSLEFARVAERVLALEPNPPTAERLERHPELSHRRSACAAALVRGAIDHGRCRMDRRRSARGFGAQDRCRGRRACGPAGR
jgi:hypothetical protein